MINFAEIFLFFLSLAVAFYYAYLISGIYDGWEKSKETFVQKPLKHYHNFTILIPARKEEDNIDMCLSSIENLNYPASFIRVIVIDDHCSDNTKKLNKKFTSVDIIKNEGKGKKDAITTGVNAANSDYIITLEADCTVHPDLVLLYNQKILNNPKLLFIAGGVIFDEKKGVVGWFQGLDILSLMASTAYGIHNYAFYLANGANMCFKRETFLAWTTFECNKNIHFGDDVFLINKGSASRSSEAVSFLKSRRGAVIKQPGLTISDLFQQRNHWAIKFNDYANSKLVHIQGTVFFIHFFALVLLVLTFWQPLSAFLLFLLLMIKAVIDYLFLIRMASFYQVKWSVPGFITTTFFYYPYIFYIAVTTLVRGLYEWLKKKD